MRTRTPRTITVIASLTLLSVLVADTPRSAGAQHVLLTTSDAFIADCDVSPAQATVVWSASTDGSPAPEDTYVEAEWGVDYGFSNLWDDSGQDSQIGGLVAEIDEKEPVGWSGSPQGSYFHAYIYSYHAADWNVVQLDDRKEGHDYVWDHDCDPALPSMP